MKRLIKKTENQMINNTLETRPFLIPTTPIYNPLGPGNPNSEWAATDAKSYSRYINQDFIKKEQEKEIAEEKIEKEIMERKPKKN